MFLGTYFHTVDERNRVSIPKKFRSYLGKEAILTRGLDGCLFLYAKRSWARIEKNIQAAPITRADARNFGRFILSGAMEISFDRLGRMIVPGYLKEFAGIEKETAILGVGERVEIWAKERWRKHTTEIDKKSNQIAERLSQSGF